MLVSQKAVAEHLALSTRWIRRLTASGVLAKGARGLYDLDANRLSYLEHLRGVAAGRTPQNGDGGLDLVAERARLAKEQADQTALKNAVARGELLPSGEVETAWTALASAMRSRMLGVPSSIAAELAAASTAAACHKITESAIHEALTALAETKVDPPPPEE
jgi:phage terminase Nu1 subunit (DNA packaging protein)